jgi:Arc-like DNA binding domain
MLRLPQRLRRIIEKRADHNRHSLNTEVIHMLEEALAKEDRLQLMQQVATTAATEAFRVAQRGQDAATEGITETSRPHKSREESQ